MSLQIRRSTYRRKVGYLICGSWQGRRIAIFCHSRPVATAMRTCYRRAEQAPDLWLRAAGGLLLAEDASRNSSGGT